MTANIPKHIKCSKELPSTGQENNVVQPKKQTSDLAFHLIFRCFSPLNCCLSVIL